MTVYQMAMIPQSENQPASLFMLKNTLKVNILDGEEADELEAYLQSIGVAFPCDSEDNRIKTIHIELKELPEIISTLHYNGYPHEELERKVEWLIHRFSEKGVSLVFYAFNPEKPNQVFERFVFIPIVNIIAIHTVDDNFLAFVKVDAQRRLQRKK